MALRDVVDELVTLCLATALEDAIAKRDAWTALDRLQTDRLVIAQPKLIERIRDLQTAIKTLECTGSPSQAEVESVLQSLEELSHTLYGLATEQDSPASAQPAARKRSITLPPEVDAQIFGEFLSNIRVGLSDFEQEIESARQGADGALAAIRRRVHTLKGESGTLGLVELEHLLHCTESFLARPVAPWERADGLLLVHDWIREAINAYSTMEHPAASPAYVEALLNRQQNPPEGAAQVVRSALEATAEVPGDATERQVARVPADARVTNADAAHPAAGHGQVFFADSTSQMPATEPTTATTDSDGCPWPLEDDELVVEFLHEVEEHLATVDQVLIDTEHAGLDPERLNKLFRAFHTLKGVASFLHLLQFKDLTHSTETMLDRIRGGHPIPLRCAVDLVFDATGVLRELAKLVQLSLASHCSLPQHDGVAALIDRLAHTTEGRCNDESTAVAPAQPGEKLGEILVRQGVVNPSTIVRVLEMQKSTGHKLGEELIAAAAVPAKAVAHAIRAQQLSTESLSSKIKEVVKIDLERVDNVVEAIGELVIVESMVSNAPEIRQLPAHLRNYLGQLSKITRELQKLGMGMRMVPVRSEFQKMVRITRDLARRSNKQVRMELSGEGTEMDRLMVEHIADPLVHLIRNAVDHGIEPPEERRAAGKPETGTVRLSASHEGGTIVIEVADDGRGIRADRVLAKAVEKGLVEANTILSETQMLDLIFAPGLSTAAQVTEVSGRGVGMDVVKRNVEAVRGRITTSSAPGRGTTFRLILPLTLAIIDGMVVRCGDESFILPTLNIVESIQPTRDMLFSITGVHEHILVRGQTLPLARLNRILDVKGGETDPTKALVIIVESLRTQIALLVDEVIMKQQVVIKTLNSELDASRMFAGAAILSSGRVGLIINVESMLNTLRDSIAAAAEVTRTNHLSAPLN